MAADNLNIGRPDNMEIIFNRQVRCVTKGVFRTAVDPDNDGVVLNAFYRHSRVKTLLLVRPQAPNRVRDKAPARAMTRGSPNRRAGLRALTARLPGTGSSASQMTYDLRRLRLKGLIGRIEHTHTYVLTPDGQRLAIFYTKLYNRLLRPLAAADQPQAPPALRQALATIDRHVEDYITRARLKPAA